MLKTLSFSKWPVYDAFAQSVRVWQASHGTNNPTEQLYEKWDLTTLRAHAAQGQFDVETLNQMEGFYKVLGLSPNQPFLTLYTRGGTWTSNQVYAPIVQLGDEGLVIKVDNAFIPLTLSSVTNDGVPSIIIKANVNGTHRAVGVQSKSRSFKDSQGKDFSVERLVLMLPVTDDRLSQVEIPFHPNGESMKSSAIAQAYFTGNLEYFKSTCAAELSVAKKGMGGVGGPMVDLNRLFRPIWAELLKDMTLDNGSYRPMFVKFTEWRLVTGPNIQWPAMAFKLDPDTKQRLITVYQDYKVECWGEKDAAGLKPYHPISEVVWVAIGMNNQSLNGLSRVPSQPGHIKILGPNQTKLANIPVHVVLPISAYEKDDQLKYFKMVYQPQATLPPAEPKVEVTTVDVDVESII